MAGVILVIVAAETRLTNRMTENETKTNPPPRTEMQKTEGDEQLRRAGSDLGRTNSNVDGINNEGEGDNNN
jgi:hypothetical protein